MPLETEKARYEELREELLEHHEGQFALIVGEELVGTFNSRNEAYRTGLKRFGNAPMLIREIDEGDRVEAIPALTLGLIRADN